MFGLGLLMFSAHIYDTTAQENSVRNGEADVKSENVDRKERTNAPPQPPRQNPTRAPPQIPTPTPEQPPRQNPTTAPPPPSQNPTPTPTQNPEPTPESMHHWTIKQSDVQDFVSKLNEIVVQEAVHNFKYIPRDFQLDPPEELQMAEVGDYTVPVMFSVIRDVEGAAVPKITNERFVYRVTVEDVNECEDETLPKDWRHECHENDYTRCVNTIGAYECHCVEGTYSYCCREKTSTSPTTTTTTTINRYERSDTV